MRKVRHKALDYFFARPLPAWGGDLSGIEFDNIYYYIKPTEKQAESWEDLPADIKDTWDKLGIPEAEKKYLAGVGAQYESEVVYHKLQQQLTEQGVLFLDMDSGLREHEEIVKQYFGTIIPDRPPLVGERAGDRLADPPRRVRTCSPCASRTSRPPGRVRSSLPGSDRGRAAPGCGSTSRSRRRDGGPPPPSPATQNVV